MEFFLFSTNAALAMHAEKAGITSIIVDWESRGKETRQAGHNLETNHDTEQDVRVLSACLSIPVTVRVNALGTHTPDEVERALHSGAGIIMLPMAASVDEVRQFLALVNRRAKTLIQIETPALAAQARELAELSWDYAYIGLNDLMVARGSGSIWEALIDGTAEEICEPLRGRAYGFGGATVLGGGSPILNILVLHELIRLGGSISIMRRTLKNELLDRDLSQEVQALKSFVTASEHRGTIAKIHDHIQLCRSIRALSGQKNESAKEREYAY